jgi:hypothetical protein
MPEFAEQNAFQEKLCRPLPKVGAVDWRSHGAQYADGQHGFWQ